MERAEWRFGEHIDSKSYKCGNCGKDIASENGTRSSNKDIIGNKAWIYICHFCTMPTFFDFDGKQTPSPLFGDNVNDISDKGVLSLYEESRKSIGNGSYTAAVLCCRKILMHVAVSKGAKEGDSFLSYVNYLRDKNYIPPDAKEWVDHIREKGNEANHEIVIMIKEDAENLVEFTEMLLKIIYEFPEKSKKREIK
jgi:hypothetical protein